MHSEINLIFVVNFVATEHRLNTSQFRDRDSGPVPSTYHHLLGLASACFPSVFSPTTYIYFLPPPFQRENTSVSTVTRLRVGRPGFDSRQGQGNFYLRHRVQKSSGAHPTSYPMGTRDSFTPGLKRPRRESDLSPSPSAELKNAYSYISTPPYVFMKWYSFEYSRKFTLSF
jgi:hypothetical protein